MALPTVAVGDGTFTVYQDQAAADLYADAASHAETWRGLVDDDKARYLVTATRILNRQNWKGDLVAADQLLAFPRTNMNITPEPVVDDNDIPVDIDNAAIELAFALADGSDVQNQQTTAERIQSMSAGSVSITNFRGIDIPSRFPQIVQELLRVYLGGSGNAFVAKATGVDMETIFPTDLGFNTGGL